MVEVAVIVSLIVGAKEKAEIGFVDVSITVNEKPVESTMVSVRTKNDA